MSRVALRALARERELARHVPYAAHLSRHVIATRGGDLVFGYRLRGRSFETRDDAELNEWHERLNLLWRNLAQPQLAVWSHVVRERVAVAPVVEGEGFAGRLSRAHAARIARTRLRANRLYLTFVLRAHALPVESLAARLRARRATPDDARATEALDACAALMRQIEAALARYEPERLGAVEARGWMRSTLLEFLGFLVNGFEEPRQLPPGPLDAALGVVRPMFGAESIELRGPTRSRLGAALALKEYPGQTTPGVLNRLLSLDASFVLTQSFAFLPKSTALGLLTRQYQRLTNAGDVAVSQAEQLKDALDRLGGNEFVIGDHHLSLLLLSEPLSGSAAAAEVERLEKQLADARALLADTGCVVAREDLALEACYWAQLPGNFAYRARRAPISSRNFAAFVPLQDFPIGRRDGNHWGEALGCLTTRAGGPYWFSLHASDPSAADGGSRRDTGHTLICGPTGSGKTVFLGWCVARLHAGGATQIVFDKDRGLEILVRALGGEYRTLRAGRPSGLNPLQLPDGPEHLEFLRSWLACLVTPAGGALRAREQAELENALRGTLALPRERRRLSRLLEFLDPTDPEGVRARLAPWCAAAQGERAWAFDAGDDAIGSLLGAHAVLGFDVTDFLDLPAVRTPVTLYLFHLVRGLIDGRRLVVWMDEFARLLADPAFEGFAKDGLKTWRKMNAVAAFATQSAADVLGSPIARTLVEQTPTKVLFPNPDADRREYREGFGLGEREFEWLKRGLAPGSRQFLVKQGHDSVIAELDLAGLEAELAVLSGRASHVARMEALIEAHGDGWLEAFLGD